MFIYQTKENQSVFSKSNSVTKFFFLWKSFLFTARTFQHHKSKNTKISMQNYFGNNSEQRTKFLSCLSFYLNFKKMLIFIILFIFNLLVPKVTPTSEVEAEKTKQVISADDINPVIVDEVRGFFFLLFLFSAN